MIRARTLIEDVGRFLADYDVAGAAQDQFVTWSQLDLLSYFRLAVQRVLAADPKSFTRLVAVNVPTDGVVSLPPECDECLGAVKYTDAAGRVTLKPNFLASASYVVSRPVCIGSNTRVSVMRDAVDRRTLFVTPATGELTITCTQSPSIGGVEAAVDMPAKYEPIIFDFMVALAFGTEVESAPMRTRSDEHMKRAMEMLGAVAPPIVTRKK